MAVLGESGEQETKSVINPFCSNPGINATSEGPQIHGNIPIMLYGAGFCGIMFKELMNEVGLTPQCFLDKSIAKQGTIIQGIPVHAPGSMVEMSNSLVIVCLLQKGAVYEEIRKSLQQYGYVNIHHFLEYRNCALLFHNQPLVVHPDIAQIHNHKQSIHRVEQVLGDDLSRKTYQAIFRFLVENPDSEIPSFPLSMQYFQDGLYLHNHEEVFIDCGAFKGDTLECFVQHQCLDRWHYVAIEPFTPYLDVLNQKLSKFDHGRTQVIPVALSDQKGSLHMHDYGGENAIVAVHGELTVPCDTLDTLLADFSPTMIKIDIEGYEKQALTGADLTIRTHKPLLAIAIYHHLEDLWEIPLRIVRKYPWYTLYIRSYMNLAETVLYAIPNNRRVR